MGGVAVAVAQLCSEPTHPGGPSAAGSAARHLPAGCCGEEGCGARAGPQHSGPVCRSQRSRRRRPPTACSSASWCCSASCSGSAGSRTSPRPPRRWAGSGVSAPACWAARSRVAVGVGQGQRGKQVTRLRTVSSVRRETRRKQRSLLWGPHRTQRSHGEAGAGGLPRVQGQPGLRREPAQKMVIHGRQPAPLSLDLTRARAAPGPLACPAVSSRMRVPVHRCFLVASTQQSCGAPTVSPSPGHTHAHLRHPHSWVWLTAAQVFGLLFASCPPEELVAHWKAAKTAKRPPGSAAVRFLTEDLPLKVRGPPVLRGPWTWAALGELSHMTQQGQHRRVPCVVKSDWAVVRDGRWDIR